jgi:hypothetical protein
VTKIRIDYCGSLELSVEYGGSYELAHVNHEQKKLQTKKKQEGNKKAEAN